MKADEVADWIVAVFVFLLFIVPFVHSLFVRKKENSLKKETKKSRTPPEVKVKKIHKIAQVRTSYKDPFTSKEKRVIKTPLKHKNLKQAIILSEILKRPYSED